MATAQVLPKELRLAAPPTMPRARSYLFKQQSTQPNYNMGETIQINIPRLQRSYLTKDSYLKFAVTVGATQATGSLSTAVCLDNCGAFGLIDKIEVYDYLGSTLLESTSGHGQLMSLLMDLGTGVTDNTTHHNATTGTYMARPIGGIAPVLSVVGSASGTYGASAACTYTVNNAGTPDLAPALSIATVPVAASSAVAIEQTVPADADTARWSAPTGAPLLLASSSTTTVNMYTREFAIPLFSFLGLLSTKYAPLHNGYTINITLNPSNIAFGVTQATAACVTQTLQDTASKLAIPCALTSAKISDVYLASQVLELGGEAEALLAASTGGQPLIVPTKAFRNYVGAMDGSSSTFRLDLNLNVASLTNILWMMRCTSGVQSYTAQYNKSLSERIRNFLQSWYFQYGSSILPQNAGIQARSRTITNGSTTAVPNQTYGPVGAYDASESYIELLKARHAWNTPNHFQRFGLAEYTQDMVDQNSILNVGCAGVPTGKFAAGLDLELVAGRSNDMICGMNTNGMNTSIYANFDATNYPSSGNVGMRAARVDAWCEYDAFINVLPGIATTVSF